MKGINLIFNDLIWNLYNPWYCSSRNLRSVLEKFLALPRRESPSVMKHIWYSTSSSSSWTHFLCETCACLPTYLWYTFCYSVMVNKLFSQMFGVISMKVYSLELQNCSLNARYSLVSYPGHPFFWWGSVLHFSRGCSQHILSPPPNRVNKLSNTIDPNGSRNFAQITRTHDNQVKISSLYSKLQR